MHRTGKQDGTKRKGKNVGGGGGGGSVSKKDRAMAKERGGGRGGASVVSSRGFRSCQTLEGKGANSTSPAAKTGTSSSAPGGRGVKELLEESNSESESEHVASDKGGKGDTDTAAHPETPLKTKNKRRRYILFVGNLPKAVTKDEIISHFEKKGVHIKEFRLLTHKDTGNSKGCGFMELSCDRELQNALKFHRTPLKKRHLNIEVTCGGGGKTDRRKAKIEEKNRTLRLKKSMAHPVKHKALY